MATFDERAREWDTPTTDDEWPRGSPSAIRSAVALTPDDADGRGRRRDRAARAGARATTSASSSSPSRPTGMLEVAREKLAAARAASVTSAVALRPPGRSAAWSRRSTSRSRCSCSTTSRTRRPRWRAIRRPAAARRPARPVRPRHRGRDASTTPDAEGIHHLGFDRDAPRAASRRLPASPTWHSGPRTSTRTSAVRSRCSCSTATRT